MNAENNTMRTDTEIIADLYEAIRNHTRRTWNEFCNEVIDTEFFQQEASNMATPTKVKPGDTISVSHTCVFNGTEVNHKVPVEVLAAEEAANTIGYKALKCDMKVIEWVVIKTDI